MNCTVRAVEPLAEGFFYLSLEPDEPIGAVSPGQFVMIQCARSTDPLLRRPMSIADFEPDGSRFGLVIQVTGPGTRLLFGLVPNDRIDALGPFGAGFTLPEDDKPLWIVAGGTGIAPFIGMMGSARGRREDITLFTGARASGLLLYKDYFKKAGVRLFTATEDGSEGYRGFVTELFERELERSAAPLVFTCGPALMMRAVARISMNRGIRCFASLENRMACGFGACLGCVAKVAGEDRYTTVCRKGPVFDVTTVEI